MDCGLAKFNTLAYGMPMTNRLTPEDWIALGFRTLAQVGPTALKAEPLARALGTTKGSFYWHFKDVPAFHSAMLALWEDRALSDIIDALAPIPDPADRLRALAKRAAAPAPETFGGARIEPAIRAWALQNPLIAKGVAQVDAGRIAYLESLLRACGKPRAYAVVIYGAYIGLDDLTAKGTEGCNNGLSDLIELIVER